MQMADILRAYCILKTSFWEMIYKEGSKKIPKSVSLPAKTAEAQGGHLLKLNRGGGELVGKRRITRAPS